MPELKELSVIQKTYDVIRWYIPIIEHLPKMHKFSLGDKIVNGLYDLLENLIKAKYTSNKLDKLETINVKLDILRYQTRLLLDLELISLKRYEYASQITNEIGVEIGNWIKKQRQKEQLS